MIKILQLPIKTNYIINQEFDWKGLQVLVVDNNNHQILDAGGIPSGYTLTSNPENGYSVGLISGEKIVTVSVGYDNKIETVEFSIQISEDELIYPNAGAFEFTGILPTSNFIGITPFAVDEHDHSGGNGGPIIATSHSHDWGVGIPDNPNSWPSLSDLNGVPTLRNINTVSPLQGGGDLSADRTISILDASTTQRGAIQIATLGTGNVLATDAPPDQAAPGHHVHNLTDLPSVLLSIAVTSPPTTLSYFPEHNFNTAGLVITAFWSDGTSTDVTSLSTLSLTNGASVGTTIGPRTIIATFVSDGITRQSSFIIEIVSAVLTNISIQAYPTTTFWENGIFSYSGLVIRKYFSNDTTEDITSGFTINSLPNMSLSSDTSETREIEVLYQGFLVTFEITINPIMLESISVSSASNHQTIFNIGDTFSSEGLILIAHYNNDTTAPINTAGNDDETNGGGTLDPLEITPPNMDIAGTNLIVNISFTFRGVTRSTTYTISIVTLIWILHSIEITSFPRLRLLFKV